MNQKHKQQEKIETNSGITEIRKELC